MDDCILYTRIILSKIIKENLPAVQVLERNIINMLLLFGSLTFYSCLHALIATDNKNMQIKMYISIFLLHASP